MSSGAAVLRRHCERMQRASEVLDTPPEALTHRLDSGERQAAVETNRQCTDGQCERDAISRGMCSSHYARWHEAGRTGPALPSQAEIRRAAEALGEWACRKCGDVKPAAAYGKGRKWTCKECESQAQRERYARGGAASRERSRLSATRHRPARLLLVNSIKMERGCLDCGFNAHPAALHFDHRDPAEKEFGIAKSLTCSLPRLMAEIAKCDVRCANCHAIRSVREGHLGRPRIPDEINATESAA